MKKIFISFLASALLLLSTASAYAADFAGIGGKPAHPDKNVPHSEQWFLYNLKPGDTKKDELSVENNSSQAVDLELYAADSTPSTDGGFALKQKVEPRVKVGSWITLSKTALHLEPFSSALVPFTITIPNDKTLDVGEHSGGILIQKAASDKEDAGGLQLSTRVGVRVYVTLPGTVIKKLEIENVSVELQKTTNVYVASITVKNSGNVSQDVNITTKVTNAWPWTARVPLLGSLFKQFPQENTRNLQVLRGSSLTSNFEFPKPLFGKLHVEGSVSYENGSKVLTGQPIDFFVPPDATVILLTATAGVFIILVVVLLATRYAFKKAKKKQKGTRRR